jgi:hypothetical protein
MTRDGEGAPESSSMLAFAWFVWEAGNLDQPIIRWL